MSGEAPSKTVQDVTSVQVLDECLVAETCIDRFLWALYQRAPKLDEVEVYDPKVVTITKNGHQVTVTRQVAKSVDADFGWKDTQAATKVGMTLMDYVIGGMDRSFKAKLFYMLYAAEQAGLSPGITSGFRDDYRQSIASGLKAASNSSYHGGSLHGGYGRGLAADVISVEGNSRSERLVTSSLLWKWIDEHGNKFGVGRPYLDRDRPHVAPVDGVEYAHHRGGTTAQHLTARIIQHKRIAVSHHHRMVRRTRAVTHRRKDNQATDSS